MSLHRSRRWFVLLGFALLACGSLRAPEQPTESSPTAHPKKRTETPTTSTANLKSVKGEQGARALAQDAPVVPPAAESTVPVAAAPSHEREPTGSESRTEIQKVLAYDPKDPLDNLEAADALDRMAQRPDGTAERTLKAPRGSCTVIDAGRRIWPAPGPAAIAAVGRGFVVAGYAQRKGRQQLFVVHVTERTLPEPIAAFDVQPPLPRPPITAPGLAARDENDLTVAFVDGNGKLWARRLRVGRGGSGAPVAIASGVDTRFSPAVTSSADHTLVAWVSATTPMHTHLALLSSDGAVLSRSDLTPTGLGATAPSFVSGATPPVLIALDAHEGMSPILRVDFGGHGEPRPAQVAIPVGMVSAPPRLAAASSSVGTYVAYTGIGAAATSAIGLVAIAPIAGSPQALVKGTAYGPLHVTATAAPRALVIAADAPTQPGKDPPHEIHVHVIGTRGPSAAVVIRGAGNASQPALARTDSGSVGLAFTAAAGVYLARLRCDDGG